MCKVGADDADGRQSRIRPRKKIATAAMISTTPIDMDMIVAVVGLCFGTRDRTQMVSTVAGTDPAAKSPATRQSTLPFLEWIAVPAVWQGSDTSLKRSSRS